MCLLPAGHFGMCCLSNLGFFLTGIWCPRHSWLQPCLNTRVRRWGTPTPAFSEHPLPSIQLNPWDASPSSWKLKEAQLLLLTFSWSMTRTRKWSNAALCERITGEPSQGIMTLGRPGIFLNSNPQDTLALFSANCSFSFSAGISEDLWNMCV